MNRYKSSKAGRKRTAKILPMLLAVILSLILLSITITAQQNVCDGSVVMDLTPTSQVWCVSHAYQGDYYSQPVNTYPVYYGPSTAYQSYWSLAGISSNQPVLELVPAQTGSAGAMFWSGYYEGGPVTITLIGTYTTGTSPVADGFEIYLFITPSSWSTTNSALNYTIPYYELYSGEPNSYVIQGRIIFPYAILNTRYIVVQWDPIWQNSWWWHSGDWNVWVGVGSGNSAPGIIGIGGGVGSGGFEPNPNDLIVVRITYYPSNNTIVGYAYDLNTGWSASLSISLDGYFTPPSPGYYTFGIAANTGGAYANWGVIEVSEEGVTYILPKAVLPPSSYFYLKVVAPNYASWSVHVNASNGWYASYSGSGSMVLGPAYVGGPGTTVTFNVTSLGDCPSPSVTYEPSSTLLLSNGANYETIVINCQPMLSVDLNVTGGGGVIALISEPGLGVKQLMLNGPTNYAITVPMNTTIAIYAWPNPGYTLRGIYINGTGAIYTENMFGAYTYEETINSNQVITMEFSGNT